jgi:hypothetical protein
MPDSRTIWRRRLALMAVIGLVVAIPVTLLVRSADDDDGGARTTEIAEQLPPQKTTSDKRLAIAYAAPKGWKSKREGDVLTLRSRDGSVRVGIAAPASADAAPKVLDDALAGLRASYESVEINRGSGRMIGGLDAKGAVVRAQSDNVDIRILVAVAAGRKRAYLVELFTGAAAATKPVAQAQQLLNSLRLKG